MFDIAIIGAGVVGGMVARALAKYNVRVCILDKESDVTVYMDAVKYKYFL